MQAVGCARRHSRCCCLAGCLSSCFSGCYGSCETSCVASCLGRAGKHESAIRLHGDGAEACLKQCRLQRSQQAGRVSVGDDRSGWRR
eukprot:4975868-Pleurochrysis_carterae.AAC.1